MDAVGTFPNVVANLPEKSGPGGGNFAMVVAKSHVPKSFSIIPGQIVFIKDSKAHRVGKYIVVNFIANTTLQVVFRSPQDNSFFRIGYCRVRSFD